MTAPVGHWGPYSPDPLRRYALRALFIHPQSLRDSPGGALGTVFPRPLASLRAARAFHSPPVPTGQPRWGTGDRIPQTPCVATLRSLYSLYNSLMIMSKTVILVRVAVFCFRITVLEKINGDEAVTFKSRDKSADMTIRPFQFLTQLIHGDSTMTLQGRGQP